MIGGGNTGFLAAFVVIFLQFGYGNFAKAFIAENRDYLVDRVSCRARKKILPMQSPPFFCGMGKGYG